MKHPCLGLVQNAYSNSSSDVNCRRIHKHKHTRTFQMYAKYTCVSKMNTSYQDTRTCPHNVNNPLLSPFATVNLLITPCWL